MSANCTRYAPDVAKGVCGSAAIAETRADSGPPRGRIGNCHNVEANEARGAGRVKLTAVPLTVTLMPWKSAVSEWLAARDDCTKSTVATTSAGVMARPSDQWRPVASTVRSVRPSVLTVYELARSARG